MANDSFTETTSTSWFSRIGNSIKGILVGIIFCIGAAALLWWNEGRSVTTAKGLAEGAKITIDVSADKIDPSNEGKLIHVTGKADAKDVVKDEVFGATTIGLIKLRRNVELFQWVEDKKETKKTELGGKETTVTEYTYTTQWDDEVHDSSQFRKPEGHANPEPHFKPETFMSQAATLGAFRLPESLLSAWSDYKPHALPKVEELPAELSKTAKIQGDWLVISATPDTPKVGDARVQFESITAGDASVLARQVKDTFEPFPTKAGTTISRINSGVLSKEAMFAAAESENAIMTWILRLVGFVLMTIGLGMLLAPLKVLADVVPFLGRIVGAGTGFVSFILALSLTFTIIALAWLWYRPLLGIALLAVAGGGFFVLGRASVKKAA